MTFRWYFKGNLIEKNQRHEVDKISGRLTIYSVNEIDVGVYRCDSFSSVGDYSTTVELVVQGLLQ